MATDPLIEAIEKLLENDSTGIIRDTLWDMVEEHDGEGETDSISG